MFPLSVKSSSNGERDDKKTLAAQLKNVRIICFLPCITNFEATILHWIYKIK